MSASSERVHELRDIQAQIGSHAKETAETLKLIEQHNVVGVAHADALTDGNGEGEDKDVRMWIRMCSNIEPTQRDPQRYDSVRITSRGL